MDSAGSAAAPSGVLCVCATLRMASRAVTQMFDEALRPSGLRATQFHLMVEIGMAGEAAVKDLTARLLLDQTTLTRNLAVLERDGLIEAVRRTDRRVRPFALTETGRKTLRDAQPLWAEAQKKAVGRLGSRVWEELRGQLETLARQAQN